MADIQEDSFNPVFEGELNIESIISAPLVATSKANVMILTGQAEFLLDYCFERVGNIYQPKMVEMILSQSVVDYTKQPTDPDYVTIEKMAFQVPLLCMLPINSIAIDTVNVNFDLEITSVGSYKSNIDLFERKAVLNGRIAPASSSQNCDQVNTRSSTHLKVNIHVGRLPLPRGVLSILELYEKSIHPVKKEIIN